MRKNFSLPVYLSIIASILLLSHSSCLKENLKGDNNSNQLLTENTTVPKPVRISPVNLMLTVSDDPGNKIKSDGKGAYRNGIDGVSVSFDQYGNLQFSSNSNMTRKSGATTRTMNFLFDDPLPGYISTIPTTNPNGNYRLVTAAPTAIQLIPVGGSESGIGLHSGFVSQVATATDWGCNFGYGLDQGGAESYVTATHPNATTWIMTGDNTNPVAELNTDRVFTGYYHMPFTFTFTSQ